MTNKLDYGILYCNHRDVFYAELMFDNTQWGEILLDSNSGNPIVTIWNCNFTVPSNELIELISKASNHLKEG
jgi:hypothetical protein